MKVFVKSMYVLFVSDFGVGRENVAIKGYLFLLY